MKNTIQIFMLLFSLSFIMSGCADSIIKAAADSLVNEMTETSEEENTHELRLLQSGSDFGIEWDKKDNLYAEVIYRDLSGETRETIMVGSSSMVRRSLCTFQKDTDGVAEYLCTGTGTPELGDSSHSGEITLYFKQNTEYTFFVDGGEINTILEYTGTNLSIHAP